MPESTVLTDAGLTPWIVDVEVAMMGALIRDACRPRSDERTGQALDGELDLAARRWDELAGG